MRFRNVVSLGVCFLATSPVFAQVPEVAGQANTAVQSSSQVGQADAALQSGINTQSATNSANVSSSLNTDVNGGTTNASQNAAVQGTVQGQVQAGSANGQINSNLNAPSNVNAQHNSNATINTTSGINSFSNGQPEQSQSALGGSILSTDGQFNSSAMNVVNGGSTMSHSSSSSYNYAGGTSCPSNHSWSNGSSYSHGNCCCYTKRPYRGWRLR